MRILHILKKSLPFYINFLRYRKTGLPGDYFDFVKFKLWGGSQYWIKPKGCIVAHPRNIFVGINSSVGRGGNYIHGGGGIFIGNYVRIATNVGLLTSNHDLYDHRKTHLRSIKIGDYSWVGMNSIITAGVVLGTRTIVGAGSVVTKSFPEGFCVIAGNPAKVIKFLDKDKFVPWHYEEEWYGFLTKEEFEKKRKKFIDV